jgi:transglutaminase superfamily protein
MTDGLSPPWFIGWICLDELERRAVDVPASIPQLFRAPHLRCVEVSDRLVILDLTEGVYDVTDEVGAAMWAELTHVPIDRDIPGLARKFGVSPAVLESDIADFAAGQLTAGRLTAEAPSETTASTVETPRRRPTTLRALRERATADRDLKSGFADAYAKRIELAADTTAPRVDLERLTKVFRTAEGLYPSREAPLDCLPRSLALTRFLRTAGWQAEHVIGVALYPFEAHAWVEFDGSPLNEGGTSLQRFTVIARAR